MKPESLSIDGVRKAIQRLPNPTLRDRREAALASIDEHGLPSVRDEDWKYTDLSSAIRISNRWLDSGAEVASGDELDQAIAAIKSSIDANWLVFANGVIDASGLAESDDLVVERFSETAAPISIDKPLANLNAALLRDGLRIRINAATDKPIGLLVIDDACTEASVSQASIELVVAPGCDAEIVEYEASRGDGDHYGNTIVKLQIEQAASVSYVRIQDRRIGHVQTGRVSVALQKDAELNMASVDVGGGLIRNDVDVELNEAGSSATFNGLYLAGDGQHIDNHTRVDHRAGPADSSQEYRGILNGRCRCVWNGKAIVHKGADGTDARQSNHNLLLSDAAEIDTKPELEIYADDVKCSHGTTVGQLDESALFYLRSRGLGKREATQLLVHAFAVDLITRTPVSAATATITSLVEAKLHDLIQETAL